MRRIIPFILAFILLANMVVAPAFFNPGVRSGAQAMSSYQVQRVCDLVSPFGFEHVVFLEDGQQLIGYTPGEIANLTEDIAENLSLDITQQVVELFLVDLAQSCGVQVFFPVIEEVPVEEIATVAPVSFLTGKTVAVEKEPATFPFINVDLGEFQPGFIIRVFLAIEETRLVRDSVVTYEITGLRIFPGLLIIIAAGVFVRGRLKKKKRKK